MSISSKKNKYFKLCNCKSLDFLNQDDNEIEVPNKNYKQLTIVMLIGLLIGSVIVFSTATATEVSCQKLKNGRSLCEIVSFADNSVSYQDNKGNDVTDVIDYIVKNS